MKPAPDRPSGPKKAYQTSKNVASEISDSAVGNAANPAAPAQSQLTSAAQELASQHPLKHYDHGPHHGADHHKRHSPVDMSKVKC